MKRREFLTSTVGAGVALFGRATLGQGRPCPPPSLQLAGGPIASSPCSEADVPAWVTEAIDNGWKVGTWAALSGPSPSHGLSPTNNFVDCRPSRGVKALNQGFFKAWRGLLLMPGHRRYGTLFTGPGGAHNTYSDGDCYLFDIGARTWEQVCEPRPSTTFPSMTGEYTDGTPIMNHQTGYHYYDPDTNEYVMLKGWGSPTSASISYMVPYGHALDLTGYDARGFSPDLWRRTRDMSHDVESGNWESLAHLRHGTYDPISRSWYVVSNYSGKGTFLRYQHSLNKWTYLGNTGGWWANSDACVVDPVRNVLIYVADSEYLASSNYTALLDIGNLGQNATRRGPNGRWWSPVNFGSMTSPPSKSPGLAWSSVLDGFLYFQFRPIASNSEVLLAKYTGPSKPAFPSGEPTDYQLTWSNLTSRENEVTVPMFESDGATVGAGGGGIGVWGGFGVQRWGDREVAFFAPGANEPVYAFRVA